MSICGTATVLSVIRLVRIVVTIIKIVVPILLIVTAMTNYLKAISNGELEKTNKSFVNQIIAAIAVFMVPTLITLILNLVWPDSEVNQCWVNATSENIAKIRIENVNNVIAKLEKNFSVTNYRLALNSVNEIEDRDTREELLEKVKSYEKYVDISHNIDSLCKKFDRKKYKELYTTIEEIENEGIRDSLLLKIDDSCGKILGVDPGTYTFKLEDLSYKVFIPDGAVQNMPLIMYLHGDGGNESLLYTYVSSVYGKNFPFILVAPMGGMWAETSGRTGNLKSIIDAVCDEYNCDTSRISISGHSRGAIGTWAMVNQYPDLFYSAVPVSCTGYITGSNFKHTKVKAFCGNQGDDLYYYDGMLGNVASIQNAGGNAEFIELNAGHGGTPPLAYIKSTFEFMIN